MNLADAHGERHRRCRSPLMIAAPLVALSLTIADFAAAVPVVPGAAGYGIDTPAGRGGTVYRVTNLHESGSNSLAACVAASGPRVCVFEISGTIQLTSDLLVSNDKLTIAGQTAPSPGIMLRGAALRIQASDVLVQHLRVRAGDDPVGPAANNRDALKIEGTPERPVRNIVIDHCSFSWSLDEIASAWGNYDNVSLLHNIFSQPLYRSQPANLPGAGYGVLFGSSDGSVSLVGNLFAHQVERNPLSRAKRFVFVNNVVYNRAHMDVDLQTEQGRVTYNSVVGNVFIRGADYLRTTRPVNVRTTGSLAVKPGTRLYVKDNASQETTSDPWSVVGLEGGAMTRAALEAASAPAWPQGLSARSTANDGVLNWVLANAGARPKDRDSTDQQVVQSVRDRTGRIIRCVSNDGSSNCSFHGGGWPTMAVRTRALSLPANLGGPVNGYTVLELWLQSMGSAVGGPAIAAEAPAPPSDLRVQ